MSEVFDPYRKWLGIPPEEQPPHHYRLLGIANFEDDPDVIENAADRQMSHVRTFQSGKHSSASQKILNELAAAKLVLLNAEKRSAYDKELRSRLGLNGSSAGNDAPVAPVPRRPVPTDRPSGDAPLAPAPSKQAAKATSTPTPPTPPVAPAATAAVAKPPKKTPEPEPAAVAAPVPAGPIVSPSGGASVRSRARRKKSQGPLIAMGLIGGALLLGGVIVGAVLLSSSGNSQQVNRNPNTTHNTSNSNKDNKRDDKPDKKPPPQDPKLKDPPKDPMPMVPDDMGFPMPGEENDNGNNTNEPAKTPAELVDDARAALADRDVPTAKLKLTMAEKPDNEDDLASEIVNLRLLANYVDEFWKAVETSVKTHDPGDSVKVGTVTYTIKDCKGDDLTYDANGTERTTKIKELPALVAVAFAEETLEEDQFGKIYVAAFHAMDKDGDTDQRRDWAKQLWIEAASNGNVDRAVAKELSLDASPYLRGMGGNNGPTNVSKLAPVPEDKDLADARLTLRRVYSSDFDRIRTVPAARTDLAKKLVSDAANENDLLSRYVMYDEVATLAAEIPNIPAAMLAVEKLAQDFEIDVLREKQLALGKCLAAATAIEDQKLIYDEARSLFTQALDQQEYKTAASLGRTAERAARKARDFPAAEAAAAEVERVEDRVKHQEIAERANEKLKEAPGDPKANALVGTYLCYFEEKWDEGLQLLAKGEPPLSDLAAQELSNPEDGKTRMEIADAWYLAARRESGDAEKSLLRHARKWYELAAEKLADTQKESAENTIADIDKLLSGS